MNNRSRTDSNSAKLNVGPILVVSDGAECSKGSKSERRLNSSGQQNNCRTVESRTTPKNRLGCSTLEQRFAYVKCAFAAGAVIAFACLLYSSILSKGANLHWVVDDAIVAAAAAFPESELVRQLQICCLSDSALGPSSLRLADERFAAVLGEVTNQINRDPDNLELRLRRVSICQIPQNQNRGDLLACGLSDMKFIVSHRGTAADWVGLALLQGMTNDPAWRASLDQAKKLGLKADTESEDSVDWVVANLRDGSYRQANIIPWLRAVAEITGDHSADFLIANIYFQTGMYEDAAKEYDKLISSGIERVCHAQLHVLRGACLKWSGHPELAKQAFRKCLALPDGPDEVFSSAYKAMARGALGDRSLEQTLNGQPVTERVLYYVLSDQYQKALQVTALNRDSTGPYAIDTPVNSGPEVLDRGPQGGDAEVFPGTLFELATGIPPEQPALRKKEILEGPADDRNMITESTANIHLLREMAFKKTHNENLAAAEHREAIKFIPPNLRRELGVQ
ncbi:MAG: hypothetical protein K2W95_13755 [Candidatus Obscuribacterales bacterium]|nr:hypothetical protein [Candidatus Obscuribacterales bacterium]